MPSSSELPEPALPANAPPANVPLASPSPASATPTPASSEEVPPHFRWNFAVLTGDASSYFFSIAFVDAVTVLPVFFQSMYNSLGGAAPIWLQPRLLTGLAQAIRSAGWFLPQFFSARSVGSAPVKKPIVLAACWIGRLPILAVAILLLLTSPIRHPAVTILVLMAAWTLFSVAEGFTGVPWTDIVSRAIPARWRGRLFGMQQVIGGGCAALAGFVVRAMLEPHAPAFPFNFAVLFGLMFFWLMSSQLFLVLIREPPADVAIEAALPMRQYIQQLPDLVRGHRAFRRMLVVQVLASIANMAIPLYTLYATNHLHLPARVAGVYLTTWMCGTVIGSVAWAFVNDHYSPRLLIRLNVTVGMLAPWAALAAAIWAHRGYPPTELVQAAFGAPFFLAGAAAAGGWTGYTTYVLETVPPERRAEYIGLMNTLNFPAVLMPIVGTWMAEVLNSEWTFLFAGLGSFLAVILSARLPKTRERRSAARGSFTASKAGFGSRDKEPGG